MRGRDLSCKDFVELVTAYLEGSLPRRDRRLLDAHLGDCEACDAYLEQMRITIETTGRLAPESIEPDARDALMGVFRRWSAERA
jgi:anti-sigma factor RsiW